jgi:azurin
MQVRSITVPVLALLLAAAAARSEAAPCALAIEGNDAMAFSASELSIPAGCSEVTLTLRHSGTLGAEIMGHNWVLAESANVDALALAGLNASLANSHLPRGDARVLAFTRIVGGGESATVTLSTKKLKPGGDYTFFCSFPGHSTLMKGRLVVN